LAYPSTAVMSTTPGSTLEVTAETFSVPDLAVTPEEAAGLGMGCVACGELLG
jgi:hypothetical protein